MSPLAAWIVGWLVTLLVKKNLGEYKENLVFLSILPYTNLNICSELQ